ncbi:TPA: hypothetical protein ACS72K_004010, partial [Providencia alcalifaciens]
GIQYRRTLPSQRMYETALNNTGLHPSGDCSGRTGWGHNVAYDFGWGLLNKQAVCYRRLNSNSADGVVDINDFSFGYELKLGNPLDVPSGIYEGEVVYALGDGMDIDFSADSYSDNEVRIKIRATVEHVFYFRFQPGSENVQLSPPNGWGAWVNGGMMPRQLSKEVPFTISSSNLFNVYLQCEHNVGSGCGLKNQATAEVVPLDVKLTIPGFTSRQQPVRNLRLTTAANGHRIDYPGYFVSDFRSTLDFVVNRPEVEKMVKSPGSNWKGAVTLMFDSRVE